MLAELTLLINSLQSNDTATRAEAAEKLARMGREAQGAAVALVEASAVDDEARDWVVAALEDLGPPAEGDLPKLAALVNSSSIDTAYWAATLVGRLKAAAAAAVPQLAQALGSHPDLPVRQRCAWSLGQIGPAAAAAKPALQAATQNADKRLSTLAQEALGKM